MAKRKAPSVFSGLRHLMSPLVRRGELDSEPCYIVPVVLMVEGVHNGKLYTNEFLSRLPEAWNGEPVVVWHPTLNGKPLSANTKDVLEAQTVGRLFDSSFDNGRLRANAYILDSKLETVGDGDKILQMLAANEPIEVSTGLYTEETEEPGVWQDEDYDRIVVRGVPDHLALLPGGQGACNWQDGAGAPRINTAGDRLDVDGIRRVERALTKTLATNELSHDAIRDGLRSMLNNRLGIDLLNPDQSAFVADVFDGFFVYEHFVASKISLFKQEYTITTEDEIAFVNDPVEVKIQTSYVPVQNEATPEAEDAGHEQGESDTMTKAERIAALIANSKGKLSETDQPHLDAMSDEQLEMTERLYVINEDGAAGDPPEKPTNNAKGDEGKILDAPEPNQAIDPEAFVNGLPEGSLKESLQAGIRHLEGKKKGLVAAIRANKANRLSEEYLNGLPLEALEGIAGLAATPDYSGRDTGPTANAPSDGTPKGGGLAAPVLDFSEAKAS